MPFVSKKQENLCWLLHNKALKAGKTPAWDCSKWAKETKQKRLPVYKTKSKSKKSRKSHKSKK